MAERRSGQPATGSVPLHNLRNMQFIIRRLDLPHYIWLNATIHIWPHVTLIMTVVHIRPRVTLTTPDNTHNKEALRSQVETMALLMILPWLKTFTAKHYIQI